MIGCNESPKKRAASYSNAMVGTGYLAYRDLASLITDHVSGKKALDYGCGRGRSSFFLESLHFDVSAIDICPYMIEEAKKVQSSIDFRWVEPFKAALTNDHFDLILSQLTLVEIETEKKIQAMLAEQYKALKSNGILIHTTASEALLKNQWLSINTDYPQNSDIKNGCAGKINLTNRGIELTSYHWHKACLREHFKTAGFKILAMHQPLGLLTDPYHWLNEDTISPYYIFVLKKLSSKASH